MIKELAILTLLTSLVATISVEASAALREVTLEDAQRFAVERNYGLQALKKEVEAQESEVGIARSLFFPRFGAVGGTEVREGNSKKVSATLGYLYGTWNIFNGFSDQMEAKRAGVLVKIAESTYSRADMELRTEITQLFYRYLYQKASMSFYEDAKVLNQRHLGSARKRRSSGLASDSDLMDFELRDSFLSSEMRMISQQMAETKLGLVRLMGPELGVGFEPVGALPHLHLVGDLNVYLAQANSAVESLKQAAFRTEEAVFELRKSRSAWFPAVDISAHFGALPIDERIDNSTRGMTGLLTARWEFFSGFETSARTKRAEAELSRRELEARQALLGAMAAVEVAVRKLQSIEERVDLEKQNEERAQRLYNSTASEYGRGVKNSTDVKAAEQMLLEARLRRVGFKNEFLEIKNELERTYSIKLKVQEFKDSH